MTEEENTYSDEDYVETSATEYTYYDNGRVKSSLSTTTDNETDEIIKIYTIYEYDSNGYVSKSTEIDLSDTTYTYTMTEYVNSEVGCILRETIHSGICTEAEGVYTYIEEGTASVNTYQYNAMCEQTSQTMNAGTEEAVTSTYIYDSAGNITQQTEDEDTTTYNYDTTTGQLVSQTDPFGTVTIYEYDTVGNLTNQNFDIYKVTYNILDSLSSISIGNNNLVTYSYTEDVNQNLTRETYANGQSISYDYADNNITTTTFSGDNSARYENFYDEEGNLTSRVDYKNQTITEYSEDIIATYSYVNNTKGDLIYKVDNSTVSDDETSSNIIETFGSQILTTTYNENNTQFAFESGITLVKTFTNDDETNTGTDTFKIGDTILLTRTDTSDTNGVVTQRTETYSDGAITQQYTYTGENVTSYVKNNKTTRYTYDDNDQIIRVDDEAANLTWTYTYDNRGNLTSKKEYAYTTGELTGSPTSSIVYEYDNDEWADQLTKYNNSTITYDAVGNPLSYLGWNMTWEGGRQLKQMTHGDTTISYQYNADGLRTSKTVNGTTIHYYYGDNGIAYQTDGITNMYFLYDELGELIGVNINGATYLYLKDELGQILGMVDGTGSLVVEYKYDAWGKLLGISGSAASTIGEWNPIRYKDYYYDVETGYYYLQSRYYNPDVGRFINADDPSIILSSEGHISQYNLYTYCFNNPLMYCDPHGNFVLTLVFTGGTVLALIFGAATIASIPEVRNGLWNLISTIGRGIASGAKTLINSITTAYTKTKKKRPVPKYEKHHIVAQGATAHETARKRLRSVGIEPKTDSRNLVNIKYNLHRHLHNQKYYTAVSGLIEKAYNAKTFKNKKRRIEAVLLHIKIVLIHTSAKTL